MWQMLLDIHLKVKLELFFHSCSLLHFGKWDDALSIQKIQKGSIWIPHNTSKLMGCNKGSRNFILAGTMKNIHTSTGCMFCNAGSALGEALFSTCKKYITLKPNIGEDLQNSMCWNFWDWYLTTCHTGPLPSIKINAVSASTFEKWTTEASDMFFTASNKASPPKDFAQHCCTIVHSTFINVKHPQGI